MATVEDRWHRMVKLPDGATEKQRTDRYGKGLRWCVRWREPDGRERRQSFAKRADADAHAATVEADKLRGTYIDTRAGRELFGDYATRWLAGQTVDPATREGMERRLRRYVEPYPLWRTSLGKIKPGTVQAWLRKLGETGLYESTKLVVFSHVSAALSAAVDDEVIAKNPCRSASVRKPRPDARKVTPWPREWVMGMRAELPPRYRVLIALGAGLGLRQGEAFGLAVEDVDFLRGKVIVQRQVKTVGNRLVFAMPKGRKVREVPLPSTVRDDVAAHLAEFPAHEATLPWERPDSATLVTARLIMTNSRGTACARQWFGRDAWAPARERVGIPHSRENGCHALRHYYASTLLDAGESIKAVSEHLGHSSAGFTLATYTHLMPSSEERTRVAVDAAWRGPSVAPHDEKEVMTSS